METPLEKTEPPPRLTDFVFNCGIFYGGLARDDMRDWLATQGFTLEQHAALKEAIKPLIMVFYKDR